MTLFLHISLVASFQSGSKPYRAIDVGCAVGRAAFELARVYDDVIGVDFSKSFVDACNLLRDNGKLGYTVLTQGEITSDLVAVVDSDIVS